MIKPPVGFHKGSLEPQPTPKRNDPPPDPCGPAGETFAQRWCALRLPYRYAVFKVQGGMRTRLSHPLPYAQGGGVVNPENLSVPMDIRLLAVGYVLCLFVSTNAYSLLLLPLV